MAAFGTRYELKKGDPELIARLAAGANVPDAAKAAGVSERTVFRRLQDPAFRREVQAVRTELLSQTVGRLVDAGTDAAVTLRQLLSARSEHARHAAARTILEMGPKLREAEELADRIAAIEERLEADAGEAVRRVS